MQFLPLSPNETVSLGPHGEHKDTDKVGEEKAYLLHQRWLLMPLWTAMAFENRSTLDSKEIKTL